MLVDFLTGAIVGEGLFLAGYLWRGYLDKQFGKH